MTVSPRNKIIATNNKKHVATYFGSEYFTSISARGLEIYNKSQPQKLVCVYPGTKFIVESSDVEVKIFRI
jgi:hypothetical protein